MTWPRPRGFRVPLAALTMLPFAPHGPNGYRAGALLVLALATMLTTPAMPPVGSVAAQRAQAPNLRSAPSRPASDEHLVLAYYYGMHSRDVPQQVQQAQAAGIDGFIVWWDGIGGDRDRQLVQVLQAGRASGFRATIHFHAWNGDLGEELRGFYQQRLDDPGLVSYQGRPVLFFWATWQVPNAVWSELRQQVDPERRAIWLADGDQFGILAGDAWDGISPYAIAWSANPRGQLPAWAAKARAVAPEKLWVPPVSPGCDDSGVRVATCVQDRAGGAYYQATWEGALASDPPWAVVVSTWDEWMEQTQIEPGGEYGGEYGDLYLQVTRQYADQWKGPMPALQPVLPENEPSPGADPEE